MIVRQVGVCRWRRQHRHETFIKYANEGENYFSYIIVIISALTSVRAACPILVFFCRGGGHCTVYTDARRVHTARHGQSVACMYVYVCT